MTRLLAVLVGLMPAQPPADPMPPKLELVGEVTKIWDAGKHNAFTDLIRFKDRWYCTYREGDAHVGGDGKLRVLASADGAKWESVALLTERGIDLRDPKLSVTTDGRLMMTAGGSVYEGKKLLGRRPRVAFSKDGTEWTVTKKVLAEGDWLWRVTWHDGTCYGVSYNAAERASKEAKEAATSGKADPGPAEWKLKLWASKDGESFDLVTLTRESGGVVYIGESTNLAGRLRSHSRYPWGMAVRYSVSELPLGSSPTQLIEVENDLIAGYYAEHREAPMFQFGQRDESPVD